MPCRLAQQQMTLSYTEWPFQASRTISTVAELFVYIGYAAPPYSASTTISASVYGRWAKTPILFFRHRAYFCRVENRPAVTICAILINIQTHTQRQLLTRLREQLSRLSNQPAELKYFMKMSDNLRLLDCYTTVVHGPHYQKLLRDQVYIVLVDDSSPRPTDPTGTCIAVLRISCKRFVSCPYAD